MYLIYSVATMVPDMLIFLRILDRNNLCTSSYLVIAVSEQASLALNCNRSIHLLFKSLCCNRTLKLHTFIMSRKGVYKFFHNLCITVIPACSQNYEYSSPLS